MIEFGINNLWRSDCEKEEIKSVQIWERKQLWLEEYEDHFGDLFVTEENTQVDNAYKRKPFHDNEENEEEENKPLVRNKSDWIPRPTKDKDLEETIKTLKTNSLTSNKNVKDNLTREEKTALQNLKSDKSIIIKEADKGNAVVIMDREYYRDSILNMLQDEMSYEVTDKKLDRQTSTMIKKLLKKHETELFKEEIDYISNSKFSESYFYGLPKIHKSEEISNAISEQNSEYIELLTPNDLKFRPIVGGPNSVTQNLSHFIDIVLKPLCREVPSFIRDDLDFLNHLPKTVNPNSELITFDIVSLYTNIPHDLGITAVKYWLENTENVIENRLTKEFILASLKLILERNIFYFNGTYYHQKKGTAMGTKMAPSYATLVLGYLEQLLYEKMSHKFKRADKYFKDSKIDETKIIETLKRELKISFNIVDEQQAVNSQELLINSSQDINNVRKSIISLWKRKLNERKQNFWNFLKSQNTVIIYETWLGKEMPVIPRKLRPKTIPGEHTDDINIRRENAIRNFEVEIKLFEK
ncbi:unnamed protein product [Mytilus edulis]|uniref:Reverse transcriptase domain-containing protein n=1 Tax=Mytilus edulis TaxID=6550 RepID=A0A8S3PMM0_MYTED|nr:unnamed protein product [Mytilus edulis]